jgi:hypothetical protein
MSSVHIGPILLVGFFVWGIYRRIRRNIGRQPLRPRRSIVSIAILSLISLLIIGTSFQNPRLLLGMGGGILLGALLGLLGLRLTKFQTTEAGHFYTPNTHIGVALSILFIGRMIYRMPILLGAPAEPNHPQAFQSPLTLFILGLTVGYYLVYQTGLLIHSRDKNLSNISAQNNFASADSGLDSPRDRP